MVFGISPVGITHGCAGSDFGPSFAFKLDLEIKRGRLAPDSFADESVDKIGSVGYQEICVAINGDVNCGFGKSVSTDFGVNQVADYYIRPGSEQITKADFVISKFSFDNYMRVSLEPKKYTKEFIKILTRVDKIVESSSAIVWRLRFTKN